MSLKRGGGTLKLRTMPVDLSNADRIDHVVDVTVSAGSSASTFTRQWVASGWELRPARAGE